MLQRTTIAQSVQDALVERRRKAVTIAVSIFSVLAIIALAFVFWPKEAYDTPNTTISDSEEVDITLTNENTLDLSSVGSNFTLYVYSAKGPDLTIVTGVFKGPNVDVKKQKYSNQVVLKPGDYKLRVQHANLNVKFRSSVDTVTWVHDENLYMAGISTFAVLGFLIGHIVHEMFSKDIDDR